MRARLYLCALADKKSGMMFYIADYLPNKHAACHFSMRVCVCLPVRLLACYVSRC